MFRRLSCVFNLYCFSRHLARFKAQSILSGLPFDALFLKSIKSELKDLPSNPEEQLGSFLKQSGITLQTLAAFLALYPDLIGRNKADLLTRSCNIITDPAYTIDQNEQKLFVRIFKIFYTLSKGKNSFCLSVAQECEHILSNETDFRFEAADMERLNDLFYEDTCLKTLLPDWFKTHKNQLVLMPFKNLKPLCDSTNKEKTASCLIKAVTLMILRDGFIVMPSPSVCRVDESGQLYFTRARLSVALTDQERFFISSFVEALRLKNYAQAAKVLLMSGYLPSLFSAPRLIRLIEDADYHASFLPIGQKADCFLKAFADNHIFFPFTLRYCVFVLKQTELLCGTYLKINGDIWLKAQQEFSDFLTKGKNITLKSPSLSSDIQTAFGLSAHHAEQLALQNKKIPSFQESPKKICDILYRHTLAARFQSTKKQHRLILTFLILFCLLIGLFCF